MDGFIYPRGDDSLDQDTARFLYEEHGANLVVEDLPIGSEFGIDLAVFSTGDKFKGVKMIPAGIHFVYASAVSKQPNQERAECGPRVGFYHNFSNKELLIKKWSAEDEDFDDSFEPDEEHVERYLANIRDLDRHLGAYRYSTYRTFLNLTYKITGDTLSDLLPSPPSSSISTAHFKIRSVPYLVRREEKPNVEESQRTQTTRSVRSTRDQVDASHLLPELKPPPGTAIRFTSVPTTHKDLKGPQELSPAQLTQFNLDSTQRLEYAFGGHVGRNKLLAEFQFAFVTLLLGQVYDCFEHWRRLLILVCSAQTDLPAFPEFYLEFLKVLRHQLMYMHSDDLFADLTDANNLVRHYLDILFQNCHSQQQSTSTVPRDLLEEADDLKRLLTDKFGWRFGSDIEQDDDEERPVIVEL